jgi:hypothetical protein
MMMTIRKSREQISNEDHSMALSCWEKYSDFSINNQHVDDKKWPHDMVFHFRKQSMIKNSS